MELYCHTCTDQIIENYFEFPVTCEIMCELCYQCFVTNSDGPMEEEDIDMTDILDALNAC